jgi:hypothetical protein
MKVKLIGGGPMNGRVVALPDTTTPELLVQEPKKLEWADLDPDVRSGPLFRIGRYSSLQPGINGGPRRLVWQGFN